MVMGGLIPQPQPDSARWLAPIDIAHLVTLTSTYLAVSFGSEGMACSFGVFVPFENCRACEI